MKTVKIIGFLAAIALLGYHFLALDYEDLRFSTNRFHYMQMIAMSLIAVSFLLGVLKDRNPNP